MQITKLVSLTPVCTLNIDPEMNTHGAPRVFVGTPIPTVTGRDARRWMRWVPAVKDRLDLPLQPRGHHRLRDPIGHSGHTQNPNPIAVRFRYLHGQHRRRKIAAR